MSEHLSARERRREMLITISYTVFSVLMIIVSSIEHWPVYYIPLITAELAFVWWSYITGFQTYLFRAFVVTACVSINVFLYGTHGENFFVLIPTLCVEFVLLSLYEIVRIMDVVIVKNVLLLLYQLLVVGYEMPDDSIIRKRIMLQCVSFVMLMVLCIYRIHHHLQEEQDVVELEKQVRREQKIKEDFVANASHELRTPVNTISGMCEILLQKNLSDDVHGNVLDIQMTGVELQTIVNDIMDYASLESDKMELVPRGYNITSTLNDVMNMTVFENRDKQLEIIFDCNPNIPCLLEGDEQQLRRVLNDLISNAIKFTNEGGVIVSVTYRPEEYGINLIVSIRDTGFGLSLDEQDMILKGFYQTDADRNRKSTGMGLGLTISSALIKKMGGFLTVRSQPGRGSEFSFAIPQKVLNDQPCISLENPSNIKLIWFYNPDSEVTTMRDAFVEHIKHFSDYFGIVSYRAASIEECKRRVNAVKDVQLVIGRNEYLMDKEYFDELAERVPIILVADRSEVPMTSDRIHVLYKPYNAMMLAEIFNGREVETLAQKRDKKRFIAPTAKILVVDDNLMNLKVVEGLLRKYRIKVVAANSGEEALSLIESQDYEFVFMDHMMPGMDGVECYHKIREKNGLYYSEVPIIALTANAIAGSREMFLSEGFSEFLAKPIDNAQLHEILQRFIPEEKQHGADEDVDLEVIAPKQKVAEKEPAGTDPFDALPGINKETAMVYCGSFDDFKELAEFYCNSGEEYSEKLQDAYRHMKLDDYAIVAHTIKSTSKTLGALNLSEMALTMEMAAKERNEKMILDNHEQFYSDYLGMLVQLTDFLADHGREVKTPVKKETEKPETKAEAKTDAKEEKKSTKAASKRSRKKEKIKEEIEDWKALKKEILESLETFESEAFEEILSKIKGKTLDGQAIEEVLSDVIAKVNDFDFDEAMDSLNKIGGKA